MLSLSDIVNVKVGIGRGVFEAPGATVIGGKKPSFNLEILKLFANGEQGFFYDPNDLSTMYQDAAGTVPVTSAGRPVGLILDKSKGLVLGGELFPITVVARANTSVEYIDNKIKITCTAAGSWGIDFTYNASTVSGYFYKVVGNLIIATSQQAYLRLVTGQATIRSSGLINTIERSSGTSSGALGLISGSVGEYVELELSVKHIAGNHAYQTTSAARPILQDAPRRIDFDAVDDKLITNLPTQVTGCTVIRSVPNVGTQILTNQTIPATYEDNKDHCGFIVINRALTPSETSAITSEFNKRAGV